MGKPLAVGKNFISDSLMTVFQSADRYDHELLWREYEDSDVDDELGPKYHDMTGYKTSVGVLRKRLNLMGYTSSHVRSLAEKELTLYLNAKSGYEASEEQQTTQEWQDGNALLDSVISRVLEVDWLWPYGADRTRRDVLLELAWDRILELGDDRLVLALLLPQFRSNVACKLNLTELIMSGWLDYSDDLVEHATTALQAETKTSGKVVVLTEGSTDAAFIQAAMHATAPHVEEYFTFLDFGSDAPGGTSWAVNLARGLAGASIANRVVVVLDNDAAGREAERQLRLSRLPASFAVVTLPDQPFAQMYPTQGPSGQGLEDVNGRACTIEFMFGPTIMSQANNDVLPPVRLRAYIDKVDDYQGELSGKRRVQEVIRSLAKQDPTTWPADALQACKLVTEKLITAAESAALPSQTVGTTELLRGAG